jgi:hypothetical protein
MKKYRITKYDPKNRNEQGHYLYNHRTEISDVGKTLEGELVTKDEYFKIEEEYINAVIEILTDSNQEHLRLVGYNSERFKESLDDNSKEWYHDINFEKLNLYEDKIIRIEDIPSIVKLNLRGYLDTTLEILNKYYVQFGYDFYMYVGTPDLSQKAIEKINSTSVFIEEFWSPYYSPEFEYVIESNLKDSMYIENQTVLKSITIEEMKDIFKLSEEHPGRIYTEIDINLAKEIGIKVDFDKYEYSITTELTIE